MTTVDVALSSTALSSDAASLHPDGLPPDRFSDISLALLDWLGVALAGSRTDLGPALQAFAGTVPGDALVLGTAVRTSEEVAALVNGAYGHALDFDDTHGPSFIHASAPVWPALLAASTARPTTGANLALSYAAGVRAETEIGIRVGQRLTARGFHVTAVLGRIGAAVAVGKLLEQDSAMLHNAITLAATQASGLTASFGTPGKPLHAGLAARDGLLSARLASLGLGGRPNAVEMDGGMLATMLGPDWDSGPVVGQPWPATALSLKPYPSCYLTHATIDACIWLRSAAAGRNISRVTLTVSDPALQVAGRPDPQTGLEGKFSVAYCAARALTSGSVKPGDFTDEAIRAADVRRMMSHIDAGASADVPPAGSRVHAVLDDGAVVEREVPAARGTPDDPLTQQDVSAKLHSLADSVLGRDRANRLEEAALNLLELGDVRQLLRAGTTG